MEYTKKQIIESPQLLKEDWIETGLMAFGFIPVIGEVADIALILVYLHRGEKMYAAIMLIALLPVVGDLIAKPFIGVLKGLGIGGKAALRSAEGMAELAAKNPKVAAQLAKVQSHVSSPLISKTVSRVKNFNKGLGESLEGALSSLKGVKTSKIDSAVRMANKSNRALKTNFRNKALEQYIVKHGNVPGNYLSRWWNIRVAGNTMRRNAFKKFIMANNMLDFFGLPSFEAFQSKIQNDADFRDEVMNNPDFRNYVDGNITQDDINAMGGDGGSPINLAGAAMSLPLLKFFARLYT